MEIQIEHVGWVSPSTRRWQPRLQFRGMGQLYLHNEHAQERSSSNAVPL